MKRKVLQYFALIVSFVFLLSVLHYWHFGGITSFAILQDTTGGNFDDGVYVNTEWNGSAVVLSGENLTGVFISRIFDAGSEARWNNLSWVGGEPSEEFLLAVDGGGDVYKSADSGDSWTQLVDNYGRTSATTDIFSGNSLYILSSSGNEVWRANYSALGWTIVNDSAMSNSPYYGKSDSSGNLYIVVGNGEVYKSIDDGVNWNLVGDINPGTQSPKGLAINSDDELFAVDGTGSVYKSTNGGVGWTEQTSGYGGTTGTDDLEIDSSGNLYILINTELYKSIDDGVSWNVINDSISPHANTLVEMVIDSNDNLYILDGIGRVFESTDLGVTWTEKGDINGGASNDPKGIISLLLQSNMGFEVRNCSSSDCSGESWQEVDLDNINMESQYFQYRVNFSRDWPSVNSMLNRVLIDYTILNSAPTISLVLPQEGDSYGDNESIPMNFSVFDADGNVDSCWYSINGGAAVFISGCMNTTFNVTGSGSYSLEVFVNDTSGEEANDSSSFSVILGAPSITIVSPSVGYFNSGNVEFRYVPSDIDLANCSLFGNFTGIYGVNQTDSSVDNGIENTFDLSLPDGTYRWAISCEDVALNVAVSGNRTFTIDTVSPSVSITQPVGIKTSRADIPLSFSVSDSAPVSCSYNVYRGSSVEIENTSLSCAAAAGIFNVTVDADFVLNLYANDSAGNIAKTNSSFSVDSSVIQEEESGGGGSRFPRKIYDPAEDVNVIFSEMDEVLLKRGSGADISFEITNKEGIFLNHCALVFDGDASNWFTSGQSSGLSSGQKGDFVVHIVVPVDTEPGVYTTDVRLQCDEGGKDVKMETVVYRNSVDGEIQDYSRDGNELVVDYVVQEYSDVEHNLRVSYSLIDFDGVPRYTSGVEEMKLLPKQTRTEQIRFDLPKDSFGEFNFVITLDDGVAPVEISKEIFLPTTRGLTGLVVSDEQKVKLSTYGIIAVVVLFFAFIIWFSWKINKRKSKRAHLHHSKKFHGKRKYLELDL